MSVDSISPGVGIRLGLRLTMLVLAGVMSLSHPSTASALEVIDVTSIHHFNGDATTWVDVSADGQFAVFDVVGASDTQVYLYSVVNGSSTLVSHSLVPGALRAPSTSVGPKISANGRYVVYASNAADLVPDDTNGKFDIFVYDTLTGINRRVNLWPGGEQGNGDSGYAYSFADSVNNPSRPQVDISCDGRFVTFASVATNPQSETSVRPKVFLCDTVLEKLSEASLASDGTRADTPCYAPRVSDDGRYVGFMSKVGGSLRQIGSGELGVFIHDASSGDTSLVSVASEDALSVSTDTWGMSGDGRRVVFSTWDRGDVRDTHDGDDVYARDIGSGTTSMVSFGSGDTPCTGPKITSNGRFVFAPSQVPDGNWYVRDMSCAGSSGMGQFSNMEMSSSGQHLVGIRWPDQEIVLAEIAGVSTPTMEVAVVGGWW